MTDANMRVRDVVKLGRIPHHSAFSNWSNHDDETVTAALQRVDMLDKSDQGWLSLSGGERQRITIARALLQDRPILVLDEATAFADPENEAALIKALAAAMRGRTVIMVAHRLSMVTQADVILLFSDGRLREMGNHAQLLEQGGLYQRLWQHYQQAQRWVPGGVQEEGVENGRQ
mgnify:CR=1 FL=1